MADRWYLQQPNQPIDGPLSTAELLERIGAGSVARDATVCPMGENRWDPLKDVEAFAMAVASLPPPAPAPARDLGAALPPLPLPPPGSSPSVATPLPLPKLPPPAALPPPRAPMPSTPMASAPPPPMAPSPIQDGPPTQKRPTASPMKPLLIAGGALGALVLLVGVVLVVRAVLSRGERIKGAIVRVTTPIGAGTGFFVRGPDDLAYVATAFHVIERGDRILIERNVDSGGGTTFVEAYPETEVVAADADADVAVIRIKNVHADRFDHLDLADAPEKDERILSYGYPVSSLAKRAGLISKDGKVLSLVKFPVHDRRYGRILRDNAVSGLLISTDIEPGFSGGPTCNDDGKVVGINVTKDTAHDGQNGAVSVVVLRELLAKVTPAEDKAAPTPEEIAAMLKRVQGDYLMLPLDERTKVRETDLISLTELPALLRFVAEVRRQERDTDPQFIPQLRLSGQAALGMFFSRLPGKPMETYLAPSTRKPIAECELHNQRLISFLDVLREVEAGGRGKSAAQAAIASCDELALRPLAWDLVAATMQWDGAEKEYAVTKVESVDDEGSAYRASVRVGGMPSVVEMWIAIDRGAPHLKVFDDQDNIYAIKSPRSTEPSAFNGSWTFKRPRVTDPDDKDMDIESEEQISISIQNDHDVSIKHTVNHRYHIAEGTSGFFGCSQKRTIETGLLQSFTGNLNNGVILARPQKDAERIGADAGRCKPKYTADRIASFKLVGGSLYMVRTSGISFPETYPFQKN